MCMFMPLKLQTTTSLPLQQIRSLAKFSTFNIANWRSEAIFRLDPFKKKFIYSYIHICMLMYIVSKKKIGTWQIWANPNSKRTNDFVLQKKINFACNYLRNNTSVFVTTNTSTKETQKRKTHKYIHTYTFRFYNKPKLHRKHKYIHTYIQRA